MKTFIAIAAAALLGLTGAAQAQTSDAVSVSVSYADLDLAKSGGREMLERRINLAIDRVCPTRPSPSELAKMKSFRACRNEAWSGARQQLAVIYGGRQLAQSAVRVSAKAD